MWSIWIARYNHFIFNQQRWNHLYVTNLIWQGLMEYARAAWSKAQLVIRKFPERAKKALSRFDMD
jgi:hypothetical protein